MEHAAQHQPRIVVEDGGDVEVEDQRHTPKIGQPDPQLVVDERRPRVAVGGR